MPGRTYRPGMSRRTFFIIDGHAQIYRCYYAPFRPLTAPSGEPTKATFLFMQMVLSLLRDKRPDFLAVALDHGDETVFRVQIDPTYKANRQPPPEDLPPQTERIVEILEAMQVPILRMPGFEADDLMATLCERFAGDDLDVVLVSRDKDLDQLVDAHVRLYDPVRDALMDAEAIRKEKGYGPEQAIDAQTLMGDSTDNVRGVDGVGPKKAADLLAKYGSVTGVLANADSLTPKLRESVREFAARADIVRQLVTLRRDVTFEFDLQSAAVPRFALGATRPILQGLALNRLLEQLPAEPEPFSLNAEADTRNPPASRGAAPPRAITQPGLFDPVIANVSSERTKAVLVDTDAALADLATRLARHGMFAFDTETTGLVPADADLVGISVACQAGTGYYIPVRGLGRTLPIEKVRERLGPIFADARIRKCGQNCKFDLQVLRAAEIPVDGLDFDTMVASFVLDATRRSHGIDALALDLLNFKKIPTHELIGKGKDQLTFDRLPIEPVCEYAAEDADVALRLRELFEKQLTGSPLEGLFREVELPLVHVLAEMEFNGVALDTDLLARLSREMDRDIEALRDRVHAAAGVPFNLDSTKQLAEVLFDRLQLPVQKRTKTGRSTDAEVLETLAAQTGHEVPRLLLEYRELAKLKGTYVDPLPGMVSRRTGRIHPSFHQAVAVTGRLSCSDPNLQNIPIRTESGARIRRAFVAPSAAKALLKADYSQIELRVLAHYCGDETLGRAFREDQDIHAFVAGQLFGVPSSEVTKEQRGRAKTVNFGIIYGQSAFGLARQTGMARGEAQEFIDRYFQRYPRIRGFLDDCIDLARRRGYAETILGRRRAIADLNSRNQTARNAAERLAVNTVIQGSAADLIKKAMIEIHRRQRATQCPARMVLQVHDELVFELPRESLADEARRIAAEMSGAIPLRVPVKVDLAAGANWLDVEPLP